MASSHACASPGRAYGEAQYGCARLEYGDVDRDEQPIAKWGGVQHAMGSLRTLQPATPAPSHLGEIGSRTTDLKQVARLPNDHSLTDPQIHSKKSAPMRGSRLRQISN